MASSGSRSRPSPDPAREQLREVRRGLFRLHKTLVDSERAAFERDRGSVSGTQFLQALIQDPAFAWLRPFSGLIIEVDEALASKEEPITGERARAYIARIEALVSPGDDDASHRYERVRQRDPDVLLAHVELTGRIETARERL